MSERDPAAARFAIIQAVRLSGVGFVIGGILVAAARTALPEWIGYPLLAVGLVDVFLIPQILARKWRTPR
jgi:hypothetical protein